MKKIQAARTFDDDILSAIENNGEVTLPGMRRRESFISKRQFRFAMIVMGLLALRRSR